MPPAKVLPEQRGAKTSSDPPRCELCGGNAGQVIDGAHNLCRARARNGSPTPCLGDRCEKCGGAKRIPHTPYGPMLSADLGPARIARAIDAWAPECDRCGGTGIEPGTAE